MIKDTYNYKTLNKKGSRLITHIILLFLIHLHMKTVQFLKYSLICLSTINYYKESNRRKVQCISMEYLRRKEVQNVTSCMNARLE
jgi:hypothetical protein